MSTNERFLVNTTLGQDGGSSKRLEWIIDATIAYPNGQPLDLFAIVFGHRPPCRTVIHYRRYAVKDIPRGSEPLLRWLYDRWTEKEALLDHYYKTGKFPVSSDVVESGLTSTENTVDSHAQYVAEPTFILGGERDSSQDCDEITSPTTESATETKCRKKNDVEKNGAGEKTDSEHANLHDNHRVKYTNSFRPLPVNDAWVLTLHAVFLLSSYIHLRMFLWAFHVIYDVFY